MLEYLKLKHYTVKIGMISKIVFIGIWFIFSYIANPYADILDLPSNFTSKNQYFVNFFDSGHYTLETIMSVACAVVFLWKSKDFNLKHRTYFVFFHIFVCAGILYFLFIDTSGIDFFGVGYIIIPFTDIPLYRLYYKYLSEDIAQNIDEKYSDYIIMIMCFNDILSCIFIYLGIICEEHDIFGLLNGLGLISGLILSIMLYKYYGHLIKSFYPLKQQYVSEMSFQNNNVD